MPRVTNDSSNMAGLEMCFLRGDGGKMDRLQTPAGAVRESFKTTVEMFRISNSFLHYGNFRWSGQSANS